MRHLTLALVLIGISPSLSGAQTLRDQVQAFGVSEEVVLVEYPSLSLRSMAAAAGAALHVRVRNSDTFVASRGTTILTDYRVEVVDILKDATSRINVGDVITIRRVGGVTRIEGRSFFSNEGGFPQFVSGGEYVLFLKTDAGQPFEMAAGPQSAYQVHDGSVAPIADAIKGSTAMMLPLFLNEVREQLAYRSSSSSTR